MNITPKVAYHLEELDIARTPGLPEHIIPVVVSADKMILDIGCGIGQTLVGLDLNASHSLFGVDVDQTSLAYGKSHFANVNYAQCSAEDLPFPAAIFDLVISRVALPYSNIPDALEEIHRVLKPDGKLWITLHPVKMTRRQWFHSIRKLNAKDVVFRSYVLLNGLRFHCSGKLFRFPVKPGRYESFQTSRAMTRALREAGFQNTLIKRGRHFLITATKGPAELPTGMDAGATRDASVSLAADESGRSAVADELPDVTAHSAASSKSAKGQSTKSQGKTLEDA